jgi:hypothetical protein
VAPIAQIKERAASRASGASFQPVLVEIDGAEVLAVAAILPADLGGKLALTFKIECAEQVTTVFTLDWALTRSEEASLVFRAKYSHFRCSL